MGSNQQSLDYRPFAFPTELRRRYVEWDFEAIFDNRWTFINVQ